ncbi:hypothetical protein LWC34_38875 [Kibdelosporangium philippinense]|uniref:Uncharacterized protein n=1 Tax=Kibdelosporangium philippinense TaxID=211113 RepID=A0ABS8ZLU3_9PSEU|nr:hypothetical protein [Kibdelosporangium philippinense]MCE7008734.1 hypothetical protein [Kibdelosporangium philippinense]
MSDEIKNADEPQPQDPMIDALLHERQGYVQRGLKDRVAQIDEQIVLRGGEPPKQAKSATGRNQQTRD